VNRWIGNHDYKASDHKYLMVEIKFDDLQSMLNGKDKEIWKKRRIYWDKMTGDHNGFGRIVKLMSFVGIISIGVLTMRLMKK
ncbi:2839_t:CDS:1, partial [Funneliformis mosseae]